MYLNITKNQVKKLNSLMRKFAVNGLIIYREIKQDNEKDIYFSVEELEGIRKDVKYCFHAYYCISEFLNIDRKEDILEKFEIEDNKIKFNSKIEYISKNDMLDILAFVQLKIKEFAEESQAEINNLFAKYKPFDKLFGCYRLLKQLHKQGYITNVANTN